MTIKINFLAVLIVAILPGFSQTAEDNLRLKELNDYWKEVSRTIDEGDFEGCAATYHEKAVLVSGIGNKAYPIANALEGWKKDFTDTKSGLRKSSVEFFSRNDLVIPPQLLKVAFSTTITNKMV